MGQTNQPNISQKVNQHLLKLAKERKEDLNRLRIRYVNERLLYRLSQSPYCDQFILKGSTLFFVWSGQPHRHTKDLDFLCFGNSDIEHIKNLFREICSTSVQKDGVEFLSDQIKGKLIKEDQDYEGVQIKIDWKIHTSKGVTQIDIGFGDQVVPEAKIETFPLILQEFKPPKLRMYFRETVIAEKFEAMVKLGVANSRMKDFYDIFYLSENFVFNQKTLAHAIQATFNHRKTAIPSDIPYCLTIEFSQAKQQSWIAFLKEKQIKNTSENFQDIISRLKGFLEPVYQSIIENKTSDYVWDFTDFSWGKIED
ncbi:nucleotidyl transferase AbiEii/AbiGii toxin family protein [Planktothrix mougeotii]|uniref:Nucleotidyl transferase AbiEii/AbiGii toxin family protein n=1 Tax=Planktothrix mougeotii LEGE 06226 TaxID=1828728 RepID=A0ABR9UL54_9CYAN|nr:nucleotidyl transferase AbiEii/AbiGii toxin family protein [Planktothrix mougeotii]MBE9146279.1 nucleotidyl transferase AbiEii/AbiGii toxin family protein [Planktothrix mougeotii LEGE 06226]